MKIILDNCLYMYYRNITMKINNLPEPCCSLEIDGVQQDVLISMFKALGNPHRFRILKYLLTHPGCITADIVKNLPVAQATTSQHLKVLKEAGWIEGDTEGPATCYHLNVKTVEWFRETVQSVF
ncbi:MAG: winged helix-turn-helix transcriptional regulator [Spirochaetales bacterium]|nr:winged helix-turn-helix transcriptional regulator [Spirochaetales bacterium]